MTINQSNFCTSPFSEIRINSDGTYNFCHAAKKINIGTNENISKQDINHYFNKSGSVKSVRDGLLNGVASDRCGECLHAEQKNPNHFRQKRNLQFGIFPGQDFTQSFNESSIQRVIKEDNKKPYFYHVSLSNLCNLGCVMCSAFNSSYLGKLMKQAEMINKNIDILSDWTNNQIAWNEFLNHILSNKQIECFHFMGGEPLYHKKFYEFINFCVDNQHTDFHITFVSNATIVPDREYIDKLKKFKSVQVEISIENFDPSNDYVRYPSSYTAIEQNMKKYLEFVDDRFSLVVRTVPQFLTLFKYDRLLDWCLENNICVDSNIIDSPMFFMPTLLPDDIKKRIVSKLSHYIIDSKDSDNIRAINIRDTVNFKKNISENAKIIINSLQQSVDDAETLNIQAVEYCAKLDRARKIHIKDYIPEILPLFEKHGYDKLIS